MKKWKLDHDVRLICRKADSFPDGVLAAHDALRSTMGSLKNRIQYGISQPDNDGTICYKAAVSMIEGDNDLENGLEIFDLKRGNYVGVEITDYMSHLSKIGEAFQELIRLPDIDPAGCCVEVYLSERQLRCMVRVI